MANADLTQLHRDFIDEMRFAKRLAPDTMRGYAGSFALLVRWKPELAPTMLTPAILREFFRWLETRERLVGRKKLSVRGVRASTVRTYWLKLGRFFDWLVLRRHLHANPLKSDGMAPPTVRYEDIKFLRRAEIERILATTGFGIRWKCPLVRTRNLALIVLALNCGLRKSELLGLSLLDVDRDNRLLSVRGQTSKSKRQRTIPLNSASFRALEDYLRERQKAHYTTPYLWVSERRDDKLSEGAFRHTIDFVRRRSGVRFHLHQLRHTFAMNYAKTSGNPYGLQHLLGHRNIATTTIYTRNMPTDALRADVEQIGNFDNLL